MVQDKTLLSLFKKSEVVPFIFARVTSDLWPVTRMRLWLCFNRWKILYVSAEGINLLFVISEYFTIYGRCLMWKSHQSLGEFSSTYSHFSFLPVIALIIRFRMATLCTEKSRNETEGYKGH